MKIKRIGASKKHHWITLLEETPISTIGVDGNQNVEIVFDDVQSVYDVSTAHQYSIILTPYDLGKIMSEVYKQALTKSS